MSLLNKSHCKEYLLSESIRQRNGKFTRVSADVYEFLEAALRTEIRMFVRQHPSVGVTLMTGSKKRSKHEDTGTETT